MTIKRVMITPVNSAVLLARARSSLTSTRQARVCHLLVMPMVGQRCERCFGGLGNLAQNGSLCQTVCQRPERSTQDQHEVRLGRKLPVNILPAVPRVHSEIFRLQPRGSFKGIGILGAYKMSDKIENWFDDTITMGW